MRQVLIVVALLLSALVVRGAVTSTAFSSGTINAPITGNSKTTNSYLSVSHAKTSVGGLPFTLSVTITHPDPRQLTLILVNPSGVSAALSAHDPAQYYLDVMAGYPACSAAFVGVTFDDSNSYAAADLRSASTCASLQAAIEPDEPLGPLLNSDPNGNWILRVITAAGAPAGTIVSWSLTFGYGCSTDTYLNAQWPATNGKATATGSCQGDFTNPAGGVYRACLADGTWSNALTGSCARKTCSVDDTTTVTWPSGPSGFVYYGDCKTGYSGSPSRSCTNGAWGSVVNPCLPDCPAQDSASVYWEATASGSTRIGTCKSPGYSQNPAGRPTRTCTNGSWGSVSNLCLADCPLIDNASVYFSSARSGALAYGTCKAGYDSASSPSRTCTDGSWSVEINSCYRDCGPYTTGTTTFASTVHNGQPSYGTCATGSSSAATPTATCNDGTLTGLLNLCVADCAASGAPNYFPATKNGKTATGSCAAGFSSAAAPTGTCVNGAWTGVSNTCLADCPAQNFGNVNFASSARSGKTGYGTCNSGFYSANTPTATCTDGTWGNFINVCAADCPVISSGGVYYPATHSGVTRAGTCSTGYVSTGGASRTCTNGVWGAETNPCTLVQCPSETYLYTVFPATNGGATASSSTCVAGYHLDGATPTTRTCSATGVWSGSLYGSRCRKN